ncbi:MAG: hypothetical protein O3A47_13465, partial [Chloroflexi bacterium]|nr:hypothetical protein [Chloroflexota bacterium]
MTRKHEVIFETDGRHSSVYLYEPPMGARQYGEPIDEVIGLGVDTISYVVGDCSVLLYDTKVGERWGHNVDLTDHAVWYKAAMNCQAMIESGADPLRVVCDHAHERGFNFLPHLLLNMHHTHHDRVTNCRVADFTTDHPELRVGPEPDFPESQFDQPNRLTYASSLVRDNRLAVIRELVSDYPTDGIEVNFATYAPFIARREVAEHTETLTEWVREIRRVCKQAEVAQGRRKRLVVRVAATVEGNKMIGQDIETWIREGLVDTVIAMPVGGDFSSEVSRLRELASITEGTEVSLIAGLDSVGDDQTPEIHRAAVVNAYAAGATGILYHRYYPAPHRYPYTPQDMDRLRYLPYPDIMAHKDKTFHIGPAFDRGKSASFGLTDQLPQELEVGKAGKEITIDMSDDISSKEQAGELWRCELRIMLNYMLHTDRVKVWWNGVEVPEDRIRKTDWVFQMRPRPDYVRGYRLHVDLKNGMTPVVGVNTLRVDLLEKDAKLVQPVTVTDIDLAVQYLPHR